MPNQNENSTYKLKGRKLIKFVVFACLMLLSSISLFACTTVSASTLNTNPTNIGTTQTVTNSSQTTNTNQNEIINSNKNESNASSLEGQVNTSEYSNVLGASLEDINGDSIPGVYYKFDNNVMENRTFSKGSVYGFMSGVYLYNQTQIVDGYIVRGYLLYNTESSGRVKVFIIHYFNTSAPSSWMLPPYYEMADSLVNYDITILGYYFKNSLNYYSTTDSLNINSISSFLAGTDGTVYVKEEEYSVTIDDDTTYYTDTYQNMKKLFDNGQPLANNTGYILIYCGENTLPTDTFAPKGEMVTISWFTLNGALTLDLTYCFTITIHHAGL